MTRGINENEVGGTPTTFTYVPEGWTPPLRLDATIDIRDQDASLIDDIIVRLQSDGSNLVQDYHATAFVKTEEFVNRIRSLALDNKLLKRMVNTLWKNLEYSNKYNAFLLEQYTQEEFLEIAKKFATEPISDIDDDAFRTFVRLIFNTIPDELTSHDLSIISNIDCSIIESKMTNLVGQE